MAVNNLEVYYPSYIVLQKKERIHISTNQLQDENIFSLLVPTKKIDDIAKLLKDKEGFKNAAPALPKNENYSISKITLHPWELHLRLYRKSVVPSFGKIQSHFEVSREYLEHLGVVQPVIYEPFEFYSKIFPEFIVWYNPKNTWVSNIEENYKITLHGPGGLTPWKPVLATVAAVSIFAGILYAINKLSKPDEDYTDRQ